MQSVARSVASSTRLARSTIPAPPEPPFELLSSDDAEVRAAAIRTLVALRDPSLFVVLCVSEAIDQVLRERALLPAAPLTWRGWRGLVLGPVLAMSPGDRMVWALEFADKLIAPQRFPRAMVGHFDRLFDDSAEPTP
jgi:hypothetical protein